MKEDTNAISGILRRLNEQKTKIEVAEQKDSVQRSFSNYCDVLKNLTDTSIELDISEILDGGIKLREAFALFRTDYLGGTLKEALIDTANPSPRELTEISDNLLNSESRKRILQAGANTVGYFISLLAGIVIMLIAVFFFLVDGRGMIQTILKLSPLKSDYEKMLIDEFVSISRAVVLATVLSALAQGVLAGIGFWIAGLNSILLLTFGATLLALGPFGGGGVNCFKTSAPP